MKNFIDNMNTTTKQVLAIVLAFVLTGECVTWVLKLALGLTLGQATAFGMIGAFAVVSVFAVIAALTGVLLGGVF
jgi:hypothetical protein